MMLFKTIDGLFKGTRYGVWAMGLVGILFSLILFLANLSLGFSSAMVFVAAFALSEGIILMLLPTQLVKGKLMETKRFHMATFAIGVAIIIMGIVYFINGTFPPLNLIFNK